MKIVLVHGQNRKGGTYHTAAAMGANQATKAVARTLFYWGIPAIRRYGVSVRAKSWAAPRRPQNPPFLPYDEEDAKIRLGLFPPGEAILAGARPAG